MDVYPSGFGLHKLCAGTRSTLSGSTLFFFAANAMPPKKIPREADEAEGEDELALCLAALIPDGDVGAGNVEAPEPPKVPETTEGEGNDESDNGDEGDNEEGGEGERRRRRGRR